MRPILIQGARVVTLDGDRCRGLGVLAPADVRINRGKIEEIGQGLDATDCSVYEARGRVLLPAFVDCHTHACWSGSRLSEWAQKLRGATYLELLRAGGGIMSTVRSVRGSTREELRDLLSGRLELMLKQGTLTAEVKSGYGLTTTDEIKMLEAICEAGESWPGTVVPTACLGHAKDPDESDPVGRTILETLPAVSSTFPGITIDAYCEEGAWTLDETLSLMDAALSAGHPVRVHADQFHDLGMIPEAIRRGFASVDHLEASTPEHLAALAESEVFGVMLPMCGLHLDDRYADGRGFVDGGGRLAIATNFNPGSAPCLSMPMVVAFGVRKLGLLPHEAIAASTLWPAELLGFTDRGQIREGSRADLVLLHSDDELDLAFSFGFSPVARVWCSGRSVG